MIDNNKRVAKNALALYLRMFISMAVSFYTSRVVLEVLGVTDYGIYNVIGGVTASFSFINASMAGATSRFITFELGKESEESLKDTFSSSMLIHIGVCILVLFLGETIGLWFVNAKLDIPKESMYAANVIYQCSLLALLVSFLQVPYNACIIAHERMGIYAYIEILNVVLKLVIVYILYIGNINKLILYGILILSVSIIIALIYRYYCLHHFKECRFKLIFKKKIIIPMLSFSGWDFYGNMCVIARNQGTTILLNIFYGVVVNAASGLASTINGAVSAFANNIMTAFRPQIIKNYSNGNYYEFRNAIQNASKFTSLALIILAIPVIIETPFILNLWLTEVPPYTSAFIRINLISILFSSFGNAITIGIHATGKMKLISFLSGSLYLLNLLISYIGLKRGGIPQLVFIINCIMNGIIMLTNIIILHHQCKNFYPLPFIISCIKIIILSIFAFFAIYCITNYIINDWMKLITSLVLSITLVTIGTLLFLMTSQQRRAAINYLKSKLS